MFKSVRCCQSVANRMDRTQGFTVEAGRLILIYRRESCAVIFTMSGSWLSADIIDEHTTSHHQLTSPMVINKMNEYSKHFYQHDSSSRGRHCTAAEITCLAISKSSARSLCRRFHIQADLGSDFVGKISKANQNNTKFSGTLTRAGNIASLVWD